jgi:hypothetical protein
MQGILFERVINQKENMSIKHIKCEICQMIPLGPEICSECKSIFCKFCINAHKESKCPQCGKNYASDTPMKNILSMLGELIIYCANKENGCKEEISYKDYLNHQNVCVYRKVKCEGCKISIIFQEYEQHEKNCPALNYNCPECGYSCKGMENRNHSCFKYYEYIFSSKMKIAMANGLASIKAENDAKYSELKDYFDFLKEEVERISNELKTLKRNTIFKGDHTSRSSNIDQVDSGNIEKDLDMFNRCLENVNMEELNKSAIELGVASYTKTESDNLLITEQQERELTLNEALNIEEQIKYDKKFKTEVYFHQEVSSGNSSQDTRGSLVKSQPSYEHIEKFLSLEKEEEKDVGINEEIKTINYLDNLDESDTVSSSLNKYVLITGHSSGTILLWEVTADKSFKTYKEHSNSIWCVKVFPQLKGMFASASIDQLIKIWDIKSPTSIKTIKSDCPVYCIEPISEFNKFYLASGGSNKNLIIWDIKNKHKVLSREVERRHDIEKLLFLSKIKQNGKNNLILCVNFNTVRLFNLNTLNKEQEFKGHENCINGIVYLKDDKFVTSSSDGSIKIWSIYKESSLKTLSLHSGKIGGLLNFPKCEGVFISGSNDKVINFISVDENCETAVLKKSVVKNEVDGMVLIYESDIQSIVYFNRIKGRKLYYLK